MPSSSSSIIVSVETIATGIEYLANIDADLNRIVAKLGPPPLWAREPGFGTLVHIILEQQVSLASARAAYEKLNTAAGTLKPSRFLDFSDFDLLGFGFSRQKSSYCRGLARAIEEGRLNLDSFKDLIDEEIRTRLIEIKGIGPWTADIYLLMALGRSDIWPVGDLALVSTMQQVKGLASLPDQDLMDKIAIPWKPWRSVAARILWHYYLSNR